MTRRDPDGGERPLVLARCAGALGLIMLAGGSFAGYAASRVVVAGDASITARNFAASGLLVRLGVLGALVMMVAFLLYAAVLNQLFRSVGRGLSIAMFALALASVPLFMLNQVFYVGAASAAHAQDDVLVRVLLEMFRFGSLVGAIFFGLWLLPLGLLVARSGFLPRILGWLLVAASPGYIILFVQGFFFSEHGRSWWQNPLLPLTHLAELSLMFWLLIRGVNRRRWLARNGGE